MLHRKPFPCSHAVLETVYTRIMPQRGHRVTWVMPSADDRSIRGWRLAEWNGTPVYLLRSELGAGGAQRLLSKTVDQYRAVRHIVRSQEIDVLQVRNDWFGGLIGVCVQRRRKIPFVYQLSFPMPEWWMGKGSWRRIVGWTLKRVERVLLREAALILPISQWMQAKLEAEGVPAAKMLSFPLGVDTSVRPEHVDGQSVREALGLDNLPTVTYLGDMGRARQLDFLLRALAIVTTQVPAVRLLMVGQSAGGDHEVSWLKRKAAELGLGEQVIYTGQVPRSEVPRYIRAADVGVSPIVPLPAYQISSPTKLFETLGMARPIVGNDIPEQATVLAESGAGLCTPYEEQAFADAIVWLLQHRDEAQAMGKKGRQYVETHRSYEGLARRVEDAYQTLVARRR